MSNFQKYLSEIGESGQITSISFPVISLSGLPGARLDELIYLENDSAARIIDLDRDVVKATLLDQRQPESGIRATRTGQTVSLKLSQAQAGHVLTPLGDMFQPGVVLSAQDYESRDIDPPAIPLQKRAPIEHSLVTGSLAVDLMVPLARGQRQAIFGDQRTGKTSFLLSTARAHIQAGGFVIYALSGRPLADIKRVSDFLKERPEDQANYLIVASSADDSPALITLTPYSAMTAAEYWRDQGRDVLLILQDLSTHAKFHREIALIAGQFPGRESYPGNIFYEHARLLERAGSFRLDQDQTASITCLPVVETVNQDLASYIVSNVISITDGHLLFDSSYYSQGIRPAILPQGSVTRVGMKVQSKVIKEINSRLKDIIDHAQSAEKYTQFGAEMTDKLKTEIDRGQRVKEAFSQPRYLNVARSVQIVLAILVISDWFAKDSPGSVIKARESLSSHYQQDDDTQELLDQIAQLAKYDDAKAAIASHESIISQLCRNSKISTEKAS